MKRFVEGADRSQSTLFPECLEDWIDEDNAVRVIDAFVDGLRLAELGFDRVQPQATGRPSYHPSVLLKLYIYGYLNRVQSSRRLEREAGRNVEVAVDVKLQKYRRVIRRAPGGLRLHPIETEFGQAKPLHESVNHADRVVLADPVLQAVREKRRLATIRPFNKTLHPIPELENTQGQTLPSTTTAYRVCLRRKSDIRMASEAAWTTDLALAMSPWVPRSDTASYARVRFQMLP